MKTMTLGMSETVTSVLGLGCMRMGGKPDAEAARVIETALDCGIRLFDHADIYDGGRSESVFARALRQTGTPRGEIQIQSKCGICPGYFDFSCDHILGSVEGSLRRLETEYLDILLLHRPDALVEPEEVAAAFDDLFQSGKVRQFGVSNQHPRQIDLLRRYVRQPLVIHQLQFSLGHTPMIDQGLNVNMAVDGAVDRDGGILDYCRLHDMTIQPWSPLQFGFFAGVFLDHPKFPDLNRVLYQIAGEQGVPASAVAIAWLLRHPAGMQPILGTMNPERLRDLCRADTVRLSRPQWYELYRAAGHSLP